jgi:hypothetical protein
MLAVAAFVIFVITAVVGWVDKTITPLHLIALACVGLACLALHLAFRVWGPDGRW